MLITSIMVARFCMTGTKTMQQNVQIFKIIITGVSWGQV